jgi:hypothetical protein
MHNPFFAPQTPAAAMLAASSSEFSGKTPQWGRTPMHVPKTPSVRH